MPSFETYGCNWRKKLPKTACVARDCLIITVYIRMSQYFLAYISFLEARGDPEFNKGLANSEVDVKDYTWKELKNGGNVTASWYFSTMVVVETICDLFNIVDIKGVCFGSREKEANAACRNIFVISNGDVVVATPHVHLVYQKDLKGTLTLVEKVDIAFSNVFIPNASDTWPQISSKVLDVSFNGVDTGVWPC